MKAEAPQAAEPVYSTRGAVTLITYPGLAGRSVDHGIVVLKDLVTGPPGPDTVRTLAGALQASLDPAPECIVVPIQKHTNVVRQVGRAECGGPPALPDGPVTVHGPATCDGLVTVEAGVMIAVSVADCIPLFALDPEGGVIGLAHCGWRGIASGIVEEFVAGLRRLGGRVEEATYLVGSSIGSCCYEVGGDLLQEFPEGDVESFSVRRGTRTHFDLKHLVVSRLSEAGVGARQISIDKTCTSCNKYLLSSYRADGRRCGRMLAFLMITE